MIAHTASHLASVIWHQSFGISHLASQLLNIYTSPTSFSALTFDFGEGAGRLGRGGICTRGGGGGGGISMHATACLTGHHSIVAITILHCNINKQISTSLWDMLICKINLLQKSKLQKNNQQIKKQPRCTSSGRRICLVHPLDLITWSNSQTSSVPWAKASPMLWYGMMVLVLVLAGWPSGFWLALWKRHHTRNPSASRPAPECVWIHLSTHAEVAKSPESEIEWPKIKLPSTKKTSKDQQKTAKDEFFVWNQETQSSFPFMTWDYWQHAIPQSQRRLWVWVQLFGPAVVLIVTLWLMLVVKDGHLGWKLWRSRRATINSTWTNIVPQKLSQSKKV